MAMAHIELAKAEAAAIGGEIAKVAAYVGIAIAVVLLAVTLLVVGSSLFFAEWLLGSMGWGVLHGVLLFIAIAIGCALAAVGVSGTRLGRSVLVGDRRRRPRRADPGASRCPNQLYTSIGEAALPGVEPGVRPLVVGAAHLGGHRPARRPGHGVAASKTWGARIGALLGGALVGAAHRRRDRRRHRAAGRYRHRHRRRLSHVDRR